MIRADSPIYKSIAGLRKGDKVWFYGSIGREMSLTESGAVDEPEFEVKFSQIIKR